MKPILIIIFLLSVNNLILAQEEFHFDSDNLLYATIKDSDGYVNIRKSPNNNAAIVGQIHDYNVFSCEPNKTDWWKVLLITRDNKTKGYWLEGYVYKNRITLLKNWKEIKGNHLATNAYIFRKDSIQVTIKKTTFNAKVSKLSYLNVQSVPGTIKELDKINGKFFWGTDGKSPKTAISAVNILANNVSVDIPQVAFGDLYEPNFRNIEICNGTNNSIYVRMDNSDGAGAYSVIWIIKDNKYLNRYIDDSLD